MPKRISLVPHFTVEELERGYREAKTVVKSRQYQIIKLLAQGKKTEEVQEITGYSRTWIYALVKRYNELGSQGICAPLGGSRLWRARQPLKEAKYKYLICLQE
jgi:transposase